MKNTSKCSDEEGAGERPALRARDDGEGEPVRGDEGVQQRHRGDAPDRRRLLRGPPEAAQPPAAVHPLLSPVSFAPPPPPPSRSPLGAPT